MKRTTACLITAIAVITCGMLQSCHTIRHTHDADRNSATNISDTDYRPYRFDNGDDYISEGLYRIVDKTGKIGYAAADGTIIISPRFAFGFPFSNGRARVTDSGHLQEVEGSNGEYHYWESHAWYWIDKSGKRLKESYQE